MPANKLIPKSILHTAVFLAAGIFLAFGLCALSLCLLFPSILPTLGALVLFSYLFLSLLLSIALGCYSAFRLKRVFVDPLRPLIRRAREFSMGQEAAEITHEEGGLIQELAESFQEMEEAAREAAAVRAEHIHSAQEKRQSSLSAARERADERLQKALGELEADAKSAREELRATAQNLAALLAGKLLEREVQS